MFLYVLMFVYLVFARNLRGLGAGVLWTSQGSYFSLGCPEMMAASVVSARVHLQHSFEARAARVLLLCFCLKLCETYQRHANCLANYAFFKYVRPCHAFPNCLVLYIHDLGDLGKLGLLYIFVPGTTWLIDYASGYWLYLPYSHFWLYLPANLQSWLRHASALLASGAEDKEASWGMLCTRRKMLLV